MEWRLTDDFGSYLAAAGDFLRSKPVEHTIQLSVAETFGVRGPSAYGDKAPLFGWLTLDADRIAATMMHTPPYRLLLTPLPERSVQPLAEAIMAQGRRLPGVAGSAADAFAFATAWAKLTGVSSPEFRRDRLYRLDRLEPPVPGPAGAARLAGAADRELLESWFAGFAAELDELPPIPGAVDDRLSFGGLTVWEVDGSAVSMAGLNRRAAGTVRVGPVYTPPELRRRGYAGAVTAAVTQAALDAGADHVVLFTDVANPTSNSVYQRLGYRAVADRMMITFSR